MQTKLILAVTALCYVSLSKAQSDLPSSLMTDEDSLGLSAGTIDESAFTFSENQLGEDEDMSQSVIIMNSSSNVYARQSGFLFSPVRFRYRAMNQKYNEVYINGAPMNDMESGQFRYTIVGGLNNITRNYDAILPFEDNNFSMPGMGGSNNYNFRPGNVASGHKISLSAANRNYTARAMWTYGSSVSSRGWTWAASLGYRWADRGYVEGTFYNSLSYYFGIQKTWGRSHVLSVSTWGSPTERASQGGATDESYWLANNYQYNPYWGYQNGKKRNSRVVNDFQPTLLATWDWIIDDHTQLTTTAIVRYSIYKSTKLNYNNADNPAPDYWKNLPSSYYDVWSDADDDNSNRTDQGLADWNTAYEYLTSDKAHRQINWDRLYWANKQASIAGADALYFVQAKHNNNLNYTLSSAWKKILDNHSSWNAGINLMQNKGMHYQTMEDLLGATSFHNINSYALGNYDAQNDYVQYDLNTMGDDRRGKSVGKDDTFGYNYDLKVQKGFAWSNYTTQRGMFRFFVAGKIGGTLMNRYGHMRNGMFADNSFGRSKTARFLDGGLKGSVTAKLGGGHLMRAGVGYQWNAPMAQAAFVSPEMNNDFVKNLHNEKVLSAEIDYQYQNSWVRGNINLYYSRLNDVTDWQNFYFDDINSFSYVSMTGIEKEHYGVEFGLDIRLNSDFDLRAIGTWSEAKHVNNADVRYMNSTKRTYTDDVVMNKGMRESGTPLSAYSLGINYHRRGWFANLNCNYYDRIYLSYSPSYRYQGTLVTMNAVDNDGNFIVPEQSRGHGGFMVDGSLGHLIRLRSGRSLSINLTVSNLLNNRHLCTGGYEQSRSDYTVTADGTMNNQRAYKFSQNPKKFYAWGTNGMLTFTYKF